MQVMSALNKTSAVDSQPKISLVATVRNEQGTIRAFVESLLSQGTRPDEIIIVDGASTDGTLEILREYHSAGKIEVISQRCNIAEGRNLGIRQARHELIAVTDAGCRVEPNWIEEILKCFIRPGAPDVVAGNFRFECYSAFEEAVTLATFSPARETTEAAQYFPSSRSVAFRKSVWQKAKGYPEWLYAAEDTLLSIRLRQLGCKFVFCRDAVVHWRPRETWRKLAKQRFNFSRGNARVGIANPGYLTNIRFHGAALLLLVASLRWWPLALAALLVMGEHVRRHLWTQARHGARVSGQPAMFFRILAVMEFVRIVNMAGFVVGRMDRLVDPSFKRRQKEWMGVDSVELDSASGHQDAGARRILLKGLGSLSTWSGWSAGFLFVAALLLVGTTPELAPLLQAGFTASLLCTIGLSVKSFYDFSQTGPPLKEEIVRHYSGYSALALLRLALWALVLCGAMAALGVLVYAALSVLVGQDYNLAAAIAAGVAGIVIVTALQFCHQLLFLPGGITASYHYRVSRLYPLWRLLTPMRLLGARWLLGTFAAMALAAAGWSLLSADMLQPGAGFMLAALSLLVLALALSFGMVMTPVRGRRSTQPNIVMIGSDTLRADRLGMSGYNRDLTPFIDSLAAKGTGFTSCYVPCARTAPSLVSMLTGTWPQRHGIRDNFIGDGDTCLPDPAIGTILSSHGYRTAAISDWSGGDFAKFPLGFDSVDVPADQWNIKYLIRQGPKDMRLFLSLFTHNRFGKRFLPELYYLAGVPLTSMIGRDARELISRLASGPEPFFLNVFMSTTHPPFGSEYPYYTLWGDPDYRGESRFTMARLTDPWDIIRRQGDSRKDFDLEQIIDLYDGCVRNFDDEVKRIVEHVRACGLESNTIIVIYSDHGMEFFEHDTWGQGNSVRGDFSARVPLIIVDPKSQGAGVCTHIVRSIDLAPTLLELAAVTPPAHVDGVSLVPYLKGSPIDMGLPAYSETGIWLTHLPGMPDNHLRYPSLPELLEVPDKRTGTLAIKREYESAITTAKDRMICVGTWKLIYQPTTDGPRYELFNLKADPECRRNVAAVHPEIVSELQEYLEKWMNGARRERNDTVRLEPLNA
jgi:arylsulfatase A-like enzyme/glycosyltransferase involved in cell wall biosynthesis